MIVCPRCKSGLMPDSRRWAATMSPFQGPWDRACWCGMLIACDSGEIGWREVRESRFPGPNKWEIWEVMRVVGTRFHAVLDWDPYSSHVMRGAERAAFVKEAMDKILLEQVLDS